MAGFLLRGDCTLVSQQIKCGVNGHALLTELSTETPRPADSQHMAKCPVALVVVCSTHTHAYIHVYHCLKFWIRTAEDMNHCVIGLGSSAGQNMSDGLLTHRAEDAIGRRTTGVVKSLLLPR